VLAGRLPHRVVRVAVAVSSAEPRYLASFIARIEPAATTPTRAGESATPGPRSISVGYRLDSAITNAEGALGHFLVSTGGGAPAWKRTLDGSLGRVRGAEIVATVDGHELTLGLDRGAGVDLGPQCASYR
jgi:hypothetical protein